MRAGSTFATARFQRYSARASSARTCWARIGFTPSRRAAACRTDRARAIIAATDQPRTAMTLHRRRFLRLAGAAVALPAVSRGALAQAYPSRPVKLIIGYPPG